MHAFETRNKMDSQAVDMVPVLDKKLGKVLERFGQFNDRVSETLNKMEMLKNQCKNLEEKLTGQNRDIHKAFKKVSDDVVELQRVDMEAVAIKHSDELKENMTDYINLIEQALDTKVQAADNKVEDFGYKFDCVSKKHESLCESLVRQEVMVTEVALKLD